MRAVLLALSLTCAVSCLCSAETPDLLKGRSVIVTWTEQREQRNDGQTDFQIISAQTNFSIYVGTNGHVFSKMTHVYPNGHVAGFEHVAKDVSDDRVVIEGRLFTVFMPIGGAARRLVVRCGEGFRKCAASLTYARQPGVELGRMYDNIFHTHQDIKSMSFSDAACIVRDGNVFEAGP